MIENKKAPAERQLRQGAKTNNHLHDNRKRKKRQGENGRKGKGEEE